MGSTHSHRDRPLGLALAGAVMLAVGGGVTADDDTYEKTIEWLGTVLPESLTTAPFGTQYYQREGEEKRGGQDGFLLEDREDSFDVLLTNGATWTLAKEAENGTRFSFVAGDVDEWLDSLIAVEPVHQEQRAWPRHHDYWPVRSAAVALYINHHCGREERRAALGKRLSFKLTDVGRGGVGDSWSLNGLKAIMGRLAAHDLVGRIPDLTLSRRDLLALYERHARLHPWSLRPDHEKVTRGLREMIAEDEARSPVDLEALSGEARIAELIYRLRDQSGRQSSMPGRSDILGTWPPGNEETRDTPANHLARLGLAAVPRLLDAMSDTRPSRAIGHRNKFDDTGRVLTIGECAEEIIRHLSGEPLTAWGPSAGQTAEDIARAWWAEVRSKGERGVLIEKVRAGDTRSSVHARKLIESYPDAALDAIRTGVENAAYGGDQFMLLQTLTQLDDPNVSAYLLELAEKDELTTARMKALDMLRDHAPDRAKEIVLELLDVPTLHAFPSAGRGVRSDRSLVYFLGATIRLRDPTVFGRLRSFWSELGVPVRRVVKDAIDDELRSRRLGQELPAEWKTAVEGFLVFLLDDTSVVTGLRGSWGGVPFNDPRLCDMVGLSLASFCGYPFDYGKSQRERDVAIARCRNVWLEIQGEPLVPVPKLEAPTAIGLEEFERMLAGILRASSEARMQRALERLARHGARALPHLDSYLNGDPEIATAARERLERLRHELSWTVRGVTTGDGAKKPWPGAPDWTDPARWRFIEAAVFELAKSFIADAPKTLGQLAITIERPGDYSGARVHIIVGSDPGDSTRSELRIEGTTRQSFQGFDSDGGLGPRALESIRAAFDVQAQKEARIRFTIRRGTGS